MGMTKRELLSAISLHLPRVTVEANYWMRGTVADLEEAYLDCVFHDVLSPEQQELTLARQSAERNNRWASAGARHQDGQPIRYVPRVN
jgi:hypothetical protein